MKKPRAVIISRDLSVTMVVSSMLEGIDVSIPPYLAAKVRPDAVNADFFAGIAEADGAVVDVSDSPWTEAEQFRAWWDESEASFEKWWQEAVKRHKPIVLLAMQGGPPSIPRELQACPLVDVRSVAHALAGVRRLSSTHVEQIAPLRELRKKLIEVLDSHVPPAARHVIEQALTAAVQASQDPDAHHVLRRLQKLAEAHTLAAEYGALGRVEEIRRAAGTMHNRLVALYCADGGSVQSLVALTPDLLASWAQGCQGSGLQGMAIVLRLARLATRMKAMDPGAALGELRELFAAMQSDESGQANDQCLPVFVQVTNRFVEHCLTLANEGRASDAGDVLEAVATLMEDGGAYGVASYATAIAGQILSAQRGGALRAVRAIERALRLREAEYPEKMRGFVLLSAGRVRERLEADVQQMMERGDEAGAWNGLSLLVRLGRSLPDQTKLAEALACFAQISGQMPAHRDLSGVAEAEARHLAQVYSLPEIEEVLAGG